MKKDFLTALIEELSKLRDEQKTITIPAPPSPADVLKVISRVAKEHEVSADMFKKFYHRYFYLFMF